MSSSDSHSFTGSGWRRGRGGGGGDRGLGGGGDRRAAGGSKSGGSPRAAARSFAPFHFALAAGGKLCATCGLASVFLKHR